MSYTPSFKVSKKITQAFTTNQPTMPDRVSLPVTIVDVTFNTTTRSIEVTCSDKRKRQCRIDRLADDTLVVALTKAVQVAYNKQYPVVFTAAGGNDPNVFFYKITTYANPENTTR